MFDEELTKSYPEAIKFLTSAITKRKLANSYVFVGNNNNDAFHLALSLSKILNCSKGFPEKPCDICTNCKWLEKNTHPHAFKLIEPEKSSKKEQIKIDEIRELLSALQINSEFFRIIFFRKASLITLTPECCNLLLKTVEETPKRTIFIFACNSKDEVLPTILSRSQFIYLQKNFNVLDIQNTIAITDKDLLGCFTASDLEATKKVKSIQQYLDENEIEINDYLTKIALSNYNLMKFNQSKKYCNFYKYVSEAHLKSRAFIQEKIVLEDLLLKSTGY